MLDIWPALPLIIKGDESYPTRCVDNIVAALKCTDRVCEIELVIFKALDWEIHLAAMQQPFPELTDLVLTWNDQIDEAAVVPDSFLGGFAPRLKTLWLHDLPFPGLPKLFLSATHLVDLRLHHIPHSGYLSPDAMVATLSTLTSLENLWLGFKSPESCPDLETRRLSPSTRSVLPALKSFDFKGASEYLEDLVTDIDALQLNKLEITFFNDIVFDTPQLIQFISRTPISSAFENAHIALQDGVACVTFLYGSVKLEVSILCEGLDWKLSSLEQVCSSCLPFLSMLNDLYIYELAPSNADWKDKIENRVWLGLFHPFTTVKNLYMSAKVALLIGPALHELVEGRTTEALPTLENVFLEGLESSGHVKKGIGQFGAARQVSSHPITISRWAKNDKKYKLSRHMKSIRVVAGEQNHHLRRDRTSRTQASSAADVFGKRSTKLWDSRVEEVTPEQITSGMASIPDSPSATGPGTPAPGCSSFLGYCLRCCSYHAFAAIFKWIRGDLIGRGHSGHVYKALNVTTGELIAVKQVELPRLVSDKSDTRVRLYVRDANTLFLSMCFRRLQRASVLPRISCKISSSDLSGRSQLWIHGSWRMRQSSILIIQTSSSTSGLKTHRISGTCK